MNPVTQSERSLCHHQPQWGLIQIVLIVLNVIDGGDVSSSCGSFSHPTLFLLILFLALLVLSRCKPAVNRPWGGF